MGNSDCSLAHSSVCHSAETQRSTIEARFIQATGFFMWSGMVMIGCFIISLVVFIVRRSRPDLIPLLLNLSWVYYLKVIALGPTFGNL